MQKLLEVKRRIRTVTNIQNITRTLATVASAKLSRTRTRATGLRVYSEHMRDMLGRQAGYAASLGLELGELSPFFRAVHEPGSVALIHITADRGMCGNYNIAANRVSHRFVQDLAARGIDVSLILKGAKGERFFGRKTELAVIEATHWPRAGVVDEEVDRLEELVVGMYLEGRVDEVYCTYTRFLSPVRREPRVVRLLPLTWAGAPGPAEGASGLTAPEAHGRGADLPTSEEWSYEPSLTEVLGDLVAEFLRVQIEDVLLESYASEQGARMITMEEATERADKALHECRVMYNRLRREVITTDLLGVLFASRVREQQARAAALKAGGRHGA